MKSTFRIFTAFTMVLVIPFFFLAGCNDDDQNDDPVTGTADFNVSLKSSNSKSAYEEINIDIQKVSIHTSTDSAETTGWFELETNLGIYDLLDYDAGNDTLIAFDSLLQVQKVSQIRLLLGGNNTIVDGGETYDLETPSGQSSGIKIQVHAELQPDVSYKVILNFEPDNSIIKTGNGKYKLKPVIQASVIEQ